MLAYCYGVQVSSMSILADNAVYAMFEAIKHQMYYIHECPYNVYTHCTPVGELVNLHAYLVHVHAVSALFLLVPCREFIL